MTWQQTSYTVPLLLSALVSFGLVGYALRHRHEHSSKITAPFVANALAGIVWSAGYALQLASADLAGKLFWSRFVWIGAALTSTVWVVFVLGYTGHGEWLTRRRLALWLVNWIVDSSGGELVFDGNEPRGSVVTLRLERSAPPDERGAVGV